jgi:hypothetical protein
MTRFTLIGWPRNNTVIPRMHVQTWQRPDFSANSSVEFVCVGLRRFNALGRCQTDPLKPFWERFTWLRRGFIKYDTVVPLETVQPVPDIGHSSRSQAPWQVMGEMVRSLRVDRK